jgi:alkylated DNA repair dioxygenase AlkB
MFQLPPSQGNDLILPLYAEALTCEQGHENLDRLMADRRAFMFRVAYGQGEDLILALYAEALTCEQGQKDFDKLMADTPWEQRFASLLGLEVALPHRVAWYGDAGAAYTYGRVVSDPAAWTPTLARLKALAEEITGLHFNGALLTLCRNGQDFVGWHSSDNEKESIASLCLGRHRILRVKRKEEGAQSHGMMLVDRSILVMPSGMQQNWLRSIPIVNCKDPHINITFRQVEIGARSMTPT